MTVQEGGSYGKSGIARAAFAVAAALAISLSAAPAGAQQSARGVPASGEELLGRMHNRWSSGTPWFHTLTFEQQTTIVRADGTKSVATWYEAILAPDRLRIDFGDPSEGNGVIYTADSVYVMRGGKLQRAVDQGNPFLPFVIGVYTQPLERTMAQLEPLGFDMSRVRSDRWKGRPVYVVGASGASDTSSAQFWVDSERLILLRMILAPQGGGSSSGRQEPMDIHLDEYVETGGGWLATKVAMHTGTSSRQTEEYSDWRTGVELDPDLFVVEKWEEVPHWKGEKR